MSYWDENYDFGNVEYGSDFPYTEQAVPQLWGQDNSELDALMQKLQSWQPQAEPGYNLYDQGQEPPQFNVPDYARYNPTYPSQQLAEEPPGDQSIVDKVTGTVTRVAGKVGNWASENPKDALGLGLGAGLGIYGLASQGGNVKQPNTGDLSKYRAMLEAQAGKTSRINDPVYEAAMARMQEEMQGGDQQADPKLVSERAQARAELINKYGRPGGIGINSDLASRELTNFDAQTDSLLKDDVARRKQMRVGTYNTAAGAANPSQTTSIFSRLADSGIQGAQLENQVNTSNAGLAESRKQALIKSGGDMIGRGLSSPTDAELAKMRKLFG